MNSVSINSLPGLLCDGKISEQEAVNALAEFICLNFPIFGLNLQTEDFRSEILLNILEKGSSIFKAFDEKKGDFFNYFYCYVITMIRSELKSASRKHINQKVFENYCIDNYSESMNRYSPASSENFETKRIPYNYKPVSSSNLKAAFHAMENKHAKMEIIYTLKWAYYTNDDIINEICSRYNLDTNDFLHNIQLCKNTLLAKNDRNQLNVERRNKCYFYHKRYELQMDRINKDSCQNEAQDLLDFLNKKNFKQERRWKNRNLSLMDPRVFLRTSNKTIAKLLDVCERQVGYYLKKISNEYKNKEKPVTDSDKTNSDED